MRWARVGARILGASRASEMLWAVSDVAAGLPPSSVWHYQQETMAYGSASRRTAAAPKQHEARSSETRTGTGSVDPRERAASSL